MNLLPCDSYAVSALIAVTVLSFIFVFGKRGQLWFPTSKKNVRNMLRLADVQPGETVYDLGSGDGRVLFIAAREFGARAVGIEANRLRYAWSQLLTRLYRLGGQVEIHCGDFFKHDLTQADVIVSYLLQPINNRLSLKLARELPAGTRVVANTFVFPGLPLVAKDKKEGLHLYIIGADHNFEHEAGD